MSGRVGHRKRLICLNERDIALGRLRLSRNLDLFPAECFFSKKRSAQPNLLRLKVEGLGYEVATDIPLDPSTGRPRPRFRVQAWLKSFYSRHCLKQGDTVCIERIGKRVFRIYPFERRAVRKVVGRHHCGTAKSWGGPTVIELFAGAGGLAYGFKSAGFQTILANEWDRSACDTLRENVTDRVLNCAIQEVQHFPVADVVAGGPPCQGFSNLGERVPNDPRNQLWRHFLRCVEQSQPKVFVLENVPPLLKSAEFEELTRIAERLGYVVGSRVLNAADYGVPQSRKRAIVIGSRIGTPVFPTPTHANPKALAECSGPRQEWVTVRQAIGHLPLEPTGENWHVGRNPTEKSLRRYRSIPPGGNRWDLPMGLMPECWKRKTEGGTDLMGRLWWDRPSVTIRTEFYKPEKGRYLHPEAHRPITHLEASLLQSFPEQYRFIGSKTQVGVQIGNAVPPLLGRAIASEVLLMLESANSQLHRIAG